jgi:DnaJ-domain-containing protein 1
MRMNRQDVRLHLLREFEQATQIIDVEDYWEDVLLVELKSGQTAAIYLLDRNVDLEEIRDIFIRNTQEKLHTLFILWSDMLIPEHGEIYEPETWMLGLYALFGGKVYAYRLLEHISIFPVYLDGEGENRRVRHGNMVDVNQLGCEVVYAPAPFLEGGWHIADFAAERVTQTESDRQQAESDARTEHESRQKSGAHRQHTHRPKYSQGQRTHGQSRQSSPPPLPPRRPSRRTPYGILGIAPTADRAAVRKAYRALARQYHPDLNTSAEATARMQEINLAYTQLMQGFDSQP